MPWTIFEAPNLPVDSIADGGSRGHTTQLPLEALTEEDAFARYCDLRQAGCSPDGIRVMGPNDVPFEQWKFEQRLNQGTTKQV